jgi:putative oxidoreductase
MGNERLTTLAWTIVRLATGFIAIPHSIPKLFGPFAPTLARNVLAPLGIPYPLYAAYFLGALELVGGVLIMIGLFTRFAAALSLVEWTIITVFVAWPKGWIYSVPGGGAEFTFIVACLYLALVLGGSGPYSLDAKLSRKF